MTKTMFFRWGWLMVGLFFATASSAGQGGVSLIPTRVIFAAADKAKSLKIKNQDQRAYLIQTGSQISPDNPQPAPFIVIPPIFRLEPASENNLRILLREGAKLPSDRESVFYLSALAVPAASAPLPPSAVEAAQLSMGFRFYIKLIYRPADLPLTPQDATCRLRLMQHGKGVQVENPTPYALTLAKLHFDRQSVDLEQRPAMIAPFDKQDYPAQRHVAQGHWQVITDNGDISARCQQPITQHKEAR